MATFLEESEKLDLIKKIHANTSPRALGLYLKQINNKLKISGNVLDIVPNDILKVPRNLPGAFWKIQDSIQNGCRFDF